MTNGILIKIDKDKDKDRFWIGVNTKKLWTATHMYWNRCGHSKRVRSEDLVKYKWIPLSSEQLVWWEDE